MKIQKRARNCLMLLLVSAASCLAQNPTPPVAGGTNGSPQAPASTPTERESFTVAGRVVNAITGASLERAEVTLFDTRMPARRVQFVTGQDGRFLFSGIPPGKYSLRGVKGGYLSAAYEQHEQYSTAIVTGANFATDDLVLRLMPMAMISGYVLDEAGEGVRHATMFLYFENHNGGVVRVTMAQVATTDDRGYFDFSLLEPGTYFLSAKAHPWYAIHPATIGVKKEDLAKIPSALDVVYPTTFYGGGTEAESAEPIGLKGGERLDITIRLVPVPSLHLLMNVPVGSPGQPPAFQAPIFRKQSFDMPVDTIMPEIQPTNSEGLMEITGIPPGRYEVDLSRPGEDASQSFGELDLEHNGQILSARGEQLGRLNLTVKVRGEFSMPARYGVGLVDAKKNVVRFHPGVPTGIMTMRDIKPGTYGLIVFAEERVFSVARTISPAGESAGRTVIVSNGSPVDVIMEVVEGTGRVDGVVHKEGKPVAGTMVILVPKDPAANEDLIRRDQSDSDGTFSLRGVVPGDYTVVAVEGAWGMDWKKAGSLARYAEKGKTVTAGSGIVRIGEVEAQPK
ncbi:MAG TPA: carboxypeptidase regulatory-like domain-containing protein [Candidatus Acidoferrum sp.]|nr:carboxypeptidase regulatory-like domain-containing protein [Candidatus Acidoferrum sp.]